MDNAVTVWTCISAKHGLLEEIVAQADNALEVQRAAAERGFETSSEWSDESRDFKVVVPADAAAAFLRELRARGLELDLVDVAIVPGGAAAADALAAIATELGYEVDLVF